MATTIIVSTASELEDALRKATGGETILLKGGDYGLLRMGDYSSVPGRYASEVTITAADPSDPPSFSEMLLKNVKNFTIDGAIFDYAYPDGAIFSDRPFRVFDGSGITIRNSMFDGDVGTEGDGKGLGIGIALSVRGTEDVKVENNEFHTFWKATYFGGVDGAVFSSNDVHSIRSDGLNISSSNDVMVENNNFHDFTDAPGDFDHRDMIQVFSYGDTVPTTNLTVRGNFLNVGDGAWTQGMHFRNEQVDMGRAGAEMRYENFVIEDNVILNGHLNGIVIGEIDGITIRNNTILQLANLSETAPPRIRVNDTATGVLIENNVVSDIEGEGRGWTVRGNVFVQNDNPNLPGFYADMFYASSVWDGGVPVVREGGPLDGVGAAATQIGALVDAPRAAFAVHDVAGDAMARVFDAASLMAAQGFSRSQIDGMTFNWEFADGASGTGPVVSHQFASAGVIGAELSVTLPSGVKLSSSLNLVVESPVILRLAKAGLVENDGGEDEVVFASGDSLDLGGSGTLMDLRGGALHRVHDAQSISIDMTVQADRAGAAGGEIIQFIGALRIATQGDDVFAILTTDAGTQVTARAKDVGINDGAAHDLGVRVDTNTGLLQLIYDGDVAASARFSGGVGGDHARLVIGDPWGKPNFQGTMSDLSVEVTDHVTDPYMALWTPLKLTEASPGTIDVDASVPPMLIEEAAPVEMDQRETVTSPASTVLFDLATAAKGDISLTKTSSLDGASGSQTINLKGDGGFARLEGLDDIENDGAFTVRMSYDLADDTTGATRLLWNHQTFGIEQTSDGLMVKFKTADGKWAAVKTKAEGLDDNQKHDIAVAIDSDLDRIQIMVDGEVVLDEAGKHDIELADTGGYDWGWRVGTSWDRWFDGEVSNLVIEDDAMFQDLHHQEDATLLG